LVEATSVLTRSEEKRGLFLRTGGVAVDMESAAIGAVADQHGIPFVVIRAVADPAEMNTPPWCLGVVDEFGRLRPLRLFAELSKNPAALLPLLRLGLQLRAAQKTLASVERLVREDLLRP
jgi:adenosylhomocysteine nucleosidase